MADLEFYEALVEQSASCRHRKTIGCSPFLTGVVGVGIPQEEEGVRHLAHTLARGYWHIFRRTK